MPVLINQHQVINDDWINLIDADARFDVNSKIIVSLEKLKDDFIQLKSNAQALAVILEEADSVEDILPFIDDLQMVVLKFKVFADGRAFSQAKLLRDRYQYQGQIRAVGDVLRDQLSFMQRCGFSQFELAESEDVNQAIHALSDDSFETYQSELNYVLKP